MSKKNENINYLISIKPGEKYKLYVVKGGSQAIGSEHPVQGGIKKVYEMDDLGTPSFFPSKNFTKRNSTGER